MNRSRSIMRGAVPVFLALLLATACDTNDGPLEEAGESIDDAATDMGNKIEDACEETKKKSGAADTDC